MYLQEVGLKDMDWTDLAQDTDKVAGSCECGDINLRVLQNAGNFLIS
jgi:hypothetical protein